MNKLTTITLFSLFLFGFDTAYSKCEFKLDGPKQPKIEFVYNGEQKKIYDAIKKAKEVFEKKDKKEKFFNAICDEPDFTYTFEAPRDIAKLLFEANLTLKVRGYNGGDDTKTLAYVSSEYPNTIFINTAKLDDTNRDPSDVANTLIHELIHNLDRKVEDARFGHGGNSSQGKTKSAPYWIGREAQRVIENNKDLDAEDMLIEETETIDESKVENWTYPQNSQ